MITYSLDSGGAERVLSILTNYWSYLGYELVLVTIVDRESFYPLSSKIRHIKLGIDKESIKSKNMMNDNFMRISKITEIFRNENPEIVISFLTKINILSIIAAKLASLPILVSERTNHNSLQSKIWKTLRRVIYPFSNGLIVQSEYDKDKYKFHKNCKVIQNPLQAIHNHHIVMRKNIILGVGRLVDLKGFDMLIEAFSKLKNREDWKLILLGEGELRQTLQQQIYELKLENIVYMPGNTKDVESYYKKASIFVHSSRLEGFPNALIEAMANGCAPIAFDCLTGPSDIIEHKINGLLVEAENIDSLEAAIQSLVDDPINIKNYGDSARKVEKKLSIEKISKQWLQVINNIINKDK
tara:strand:- start:3948 stop:5012 length:1065 start_codon:yes stop_codon:yes gene_type:complete